MSHEEMIKTLKSKVDSFDNFPKPGITFWDIFSILKDPESFKLLIQVLKERIQHHAHEVDAIVGLDARGFLIGSVLAYDLKKPFVPIRKKGKLPGDVERVSYQLEYGEDCMEIQKSGINAGDQIIIVDDLLATGGSLKAASDLVDGLGAKIILCLVCIELDELKGREKVKHKVEAIMNF